MLKEDMKSLATMLQEEVKQFEEYISSSAMDWEKKLSKEKWSSKEILGHLADSAMHNLQRFIRSTYDENFKIVYDQDNWVKYQQYATASPRDILDLWSLLNNQIVRVLISFPEERIQIRSDIGRDMVETGNVYEIALSYFDHLKHHLRQIKQIQNSAVSNF